jgi:hypothetical protein
LRGSETCGHLGLEAYETPGPQEVRTPLDMMKDLETIEAVIAASSYRGERQCAVTLAAQCLLGARNFAIALSSLGPLQQWTEEDIARATLSSA